MRICLKVSTSSLRLHQLNITIIPDRGSCNNTIIKSITHSVIYGLNSFKSIKHRAASDWNAMIRDINTIGMAGNKCNRVKGHGIIYPNDVIKKLIYNIKNIA